MDIELTEEEKELEAIFEKADDLMINKKDHKKAQELYEQILKKDADNIDALNSLAQCIKVTKSKNCFD